MAGPAGSGRHGAKLPQSPGRPGRSTRSPDPSHGSPGVGDAAHSCTDGHSPCRTHNAIAREGHGGARRGHGCGELPLEDRRLRRLRRPLGPGRSTGQPTRRGGAREGRRRGDHDGPSPQHRFEPGARNGAAGGGPDRGRGPGGDPAARAGRGRPRMPGCGWPASWTTSGTASPGTRCTAWPTWWMPVRPPWSSSRWTRPTEDIGGLLPRASALHRHRPLGHGAGHRRLMRRGRLPAIVTLAVTPPGRGAGGPSGSRPILRRPRPRPAWSIRSGGRRRRAVRAGWSRAAAGCGRARASSRRDRRRSRSRSVRTKPCSSVATSPSQALFGSAPMNENRAVQSRVTVVSPLVSVACWSIGAAGEGGDRGALVDLDPRVGARSGRRGRCSSSRRAVVARRCTPRWRARRGTSRPVRRSCRHRRRAPGRRRTPALRARWRRSRRRPSRTGRGRGPGACGSEHRSRRRQRGRPTWVPSVRVSAWCPATRSSRVTAHGLVMTRAELLGLDRGSGWRGPDRRCRSGSRGSSRCASSRRPARRSRWRPG